MLSGISLSFYPVSISMWFLQIGFVLGLYGFTDKLDIVTSSIVSWISKRSLNIYIIHLILLAVLTWKFGVNFSNSIGWICGILFLTIIYSFGKLTEKRILNDLELGEKFLNELYNMKRQRIYYCISEVDGLHIETKSVYLKEIYERDHLLIKFPKESSPLKFYFSEEYINISGNDITLTTKGISYAHQLASEKRKEKIALWSVRATGILVILEVIKFVFSYFSK